MERGTELRCAVVGADVELRERLQTAWTTRREIDPIFLDRIEEIVAGAEPELVLLELTQTPSPEEACRRLRERSSAYVLVRLNGVDPSVARGVLSSGADDVVGSSLSSEDLDLRLRIAEKAARARRGERLALRAAEERWALAGRGARDGLWHWDLQRDRLELSPRWFEMVQASDEEPVQAPGSWLDRVHPTDRREILDALDEHLKGFTPALEVEYRIETPNGVRQMAARGVAVFGEDGRPIRVAGSQTDVTDHRLHDALTGLPNRRLLLDRIQITIERARRDPPNHFAVLTFDLDRFQRFNDGFDHRTGDRILQEVGRRLRTTVRSQDTAASLGEDGFAVLVDPLPGEEQIAPICERLLTNIRRPIRIDGRSLVVTASLGIAIGNDGSRRRAEDFLRDADVAMERAKASGGDRHFVFSRGMRQKAHRAVELEAGLRDAFDRDELRNFFQPIIELGSRSPVGVEALTRWSHPELGLVPPDEFIPIAEQVGLIVRVGDWALSDACHRLARWIREDPSSRLSMSVNVSVRQFESAGLVARVEELLDVLALPPSLLRLEITESALIANPTRATEVLSGLRRLGVEIVLDDFGTGYSSLSYLHRFPFDGLKIDRSFISRMHVDQHSFQIVRTIVELGNSLGLELVAEGIEEEQQLERLIDLGCTYGQGFLFARPGPADEIESYLADRLRPDSDPAIPG